MVLNNQHRHPLCGFASASEFHGFADSPVALFLHPMRVCGGGDRFTYRHVAIFYGAVSSFFSFSTAPVFLGFNSSDFL
jgi:hypothetical protein